jgi:tRNA nucleotidyltransferase (CCA-adding enzyme)
LRTAGKKHYLFQNRPAEDDVLRFEGGKRYIWPMHASSSEKPCPHVVVTSHANADYDALASMVAAGKLYPESILIAPSMQERHEAHYFADSIAYLFSLRQAKDVDFSNVETLVVTDTRQPSRIPHVASVLDLPGLKIHLYDHHPYTPEDLQGEVCVVKQWGATTSIITHILKEKDIALTLDEATMLGLGIYEDTGSFTFSSATGHDFTAAAWLREKGMDVNIIGELVSHDITRDQLQVLNTLLESATRHDVKGIPIVIAEASLDMFLGDFSVLAHKMMDMENLKVLFAVARMGDRVQLVARSKHPDVDISRICAAFGGGGHTYAASASIKDKTLAEVKAEILALLLSSVNPHMTVGDHMTSPSITVEESQSLSDAEEIMNRFGLKAIPVVKNGSLACVGYLEQQTAARAVSHGLGDLAVSEYMQRNAFLRLNPAPPCSRRWISSSRSARGSSPSSAAATSSACSRARILSGCLLKTTRFVFRKVTRLRPPCGKKVSGNSWRTDFPRITSIFSALPENSETSSGIPFSLWVGLFATF